jgi:hypothetical protein
MFHRSLGAALVALGLLSAPAMAQTLPGLVGTNVNNSTNLAAGIGNTANQRAAAFQGGPRVGSLVNTNVTNSTNVAAGIGNKADQRVLGVQGNGVQLNFTGRGPLVNTNVNTATNVAAGIGNAAGQGVVAAQR